MADLDTLRPEVADAVSALDETTCMTNPGLKWYATIRAELLRLANENADYGKHAIEQYKRGVYWMDRAKEAEAELAALKARIAGSVELTVGDPAWSDGTLSEMDGLRVALVRVED